jgi:glycolate oxidase FAD binding subunit
MALGGESLDDASAQTWWNGLRDQTLDVFASTGRLWRLSLPSTSAFGIPGIRLIEWAGALRWLASDSSAVDVRAAAAAAGGSAMLWRGARDGSMFHPLDTATLELHRRLKTQFDPDGIFNPGRLVEDF